MRALFFQTTAFKDFTDGPSAVIRLNYLGTLLTTYPLMFSFSASGLLEKFVR